MSALTGYGGWISGPYGGPLSGEYSSFFAGAAEFSVRHLNNGVMFSLGGSIPAAFTFTRSGAATYRDINGVWRSASTNTAIFHCPEGADRTYYWTEPFTTNRMTDRNANPTDTTGWTKGGDAAATLTVVSDPGTLLSGAGLSVLASSGKVYKLDNSGGSTDATATSTGTFNVTTKCTVSAWIAPTTGTAKFTRTGTGTPEVLVISNSASMSRQQLQVVPSATTDNFKIIAPAGSVVYFILPQMEALEFASNPIVTSAATASRNQPVLSVPTSSLSGFTATQGSIILKTWQYVNRSNGSVNAYPFSLQLGTSTSEMYAVRFGNGDGSGYSYKYAWTAASGGSVTGQLHKPQTARRYPIAFSWNNGRTVIVSGPGAHLDTTGQPAPPSLDTLFVGSHHSGNESMWGGIESLVYYPSFRTARQLGVDMFESTDMAIASAGQSNAALYTKDLQTTNTGELAWISQEDTYWTTTRNWLVPGATGGTAALKNNDTGNGWWYDPDTNTFGTAYQYWEDCVLSFKAGGGQIPAIFWDQGENDVTDVATSGSGAGSNGAAYQNALIQIFTKMRSVVGSVPIIICPIGRRSTGLSNNGTELIREIQYALTGLYNWIYVSPEKFDQAIDGTAGNTVHLSPAGYASQADRIVRKTMSVLGKTVSGSVDGPTITAVSRSSTTVTATASEALTPASSIQGPKFYDGSSEITFSSITDSSATITGTLSSSPSGVEAFYAAYNDLGYVTDTSKILVSATSGLPLCGGYAFPVPYPPSASSYELMETGDKVTLEDGSGSTKLEA